MITKQEHLTLRIIISSAITRDMCQQDIKDDDLKPPQKEWIQESRRLAHTASIASIADMMDILDRIETEP
jgi:hypothetical protein